MVHKLFVLSTGCLLAFQVTIAQNKGINDLVKELKIIAEKKKLFKEVSHTASLKRCITEMEKQYKKIVRDLGGLMRIMGSYIDGILRLLDFSLHVI